MLAFGHFAPSNQGKHFVEKAMVALTPWRYAWAASATLFSAIVIVYLIFSPLGLVGGIGDQFWFCVILVVIANLVFCWWSLSRFDRSIS